MCELLKTNTKKYKLDLKYYFDKFKKESIICTKIKGNVKGRYLNDRNSPNKKRHEQKQNYGFLKRDDKHPICTTV